MTPDGTSSLFADTWPSLLLNRHVALTSCFLDTTPSQRPLVHHCPSHSQLATPTSIYSHSVSSCHCFQGASHNEVKTPFLSSQHSATLNGEASHLSFSVYRIDIGYNFPCHQAISALHWTVSSKDLLNESSFLKSVNKEHASSHKKVCSSNSFLTHANVKCQFIYFHSGNH